VVAAWAIHLGMPVGRGLAPLAVPFAVPLAARAAGTDGVAAPVEVGLA
jgi:hypothetical protein